MTDIDRKIDSFENHFIQRHFRILEKLADHFSQGEIYTQAGEECTEEILYSESGFVLLTVALTYYEMIEQFATGQDSNRKSGSFFKKGFARVHPDNRLSKGYVDAVYSHLRCGTFHSGMATGDFELNRHLETSFGFRDAALVINPARLIKHQKSHLVDYCKRLRDVTEIDAREAFEQTCQRLAKRNRSPQPSESRPNTTVTSASTTASTAMGTPPLSSGLN